MNGRYRWQTYNTAKGALIAGAVVLTTLLITSGTYLAARYQNSAEITPGAHTTDQFITGWDYLPGTVADVGGLHVYHLGRTIVSKDGSEEQANSPVNLYGTRFDVSGDFEITATIQDNTGAASLQFYDQPPVIQDEFRVESKSVQVTVEGDRATVSHWNGYSGGSLSSQAPLSHKQSNFSSQSENTLTLIRRQETVEIRLNDTIITSLPENNLFGTGMLWLGVDAAVPGKGWTLSSLRTDGNIQAVNTQDMETVEKRQDSLQALARVQRPDFLMGAAVALGPLVADDAYARLVLGGNFGQITPENALKWQFVHPQPDVYDFREADALVALAQKNDMQIHGHTLVFGEANPLWVQRLPIASDADKAEVRRLMTDHITETMTHYKGKIGTWDVINEPLDDSGNGLRQHIWHQAMGEDYLTIALEAARRADPQAKLFINEYGLEEDGERWDTFLSLVTRLRSQGVPLDGVGLQAHVYEMDTDMIDPAVLRSHIRALEELGLVVRISEMDVDSGAGSEAQARQYAKVLDACLAEASCVSWGTWGVSDAYNMWQNDDQELQYGRDFLWDADYRPTVAVDRMSEVLRSGSSD